MKQGDEYFKDNLKIKPMKRSRKSLKLFQINYPQLSYNLLPYTEKYKVFY